jgi:tyrosine-protein phosphatase SIW14
MIHLLFALALLSNFGKVNDGLYRGAQPDKEEFAKLAKMGIKTVVNLRLEKDPKEKLIVEAAGMKYVSVPMANFGAPSEEQLARVMAVLDDPTAAPVFVHCRRGADRTGTVIAAYRISHDHWTNEKALDEARSYGMSRFERAMQSFIKEYKPKPTRTTPAETGSPTSTAAAPSAPGVK